MGRAVWCAAAWLALGPVWGAAQKPKAGPEGREIRAESEPASGPQSRRLELNLLGVADTAAGESRRNENIQFNLVDNNALKELNVRMGTTATIVAEFRPARGYFGAEFGNPAPASLHAAPLRPAPWHGNLYGSHLNSVFSARSFFQAGEVQPARTNDYGFTLAAPRWRNWQMQVEGSQQKARGSVNGNVLVPQPDERTPLATDPAVRALIERWLNAYPKQLPNRTDVNARALNTNSTQRINTDNWGARLEKWRGDRDRLSLRYSFTSQRVDAFQLVAGQNPDTSTRSHQARLTWSRQWLGAAILDLSVGFDRLGSLLVPEENAVGPMVSISGLETLGPGGVIPIDRAQNLFRYGGQFRRLGGNHAWTAGFDLLRRQFNGIETDVHRGYFGFGNDFGRDSITNFRMGVPTQHLISIGNVHRGFRNWEMQYYAGDAWRARPGLSLHYAVRYQPATRPVEVNRLNTVAYDGDRNNVAPQLGFAWRWGPRRGVLRGAYGLDYGQIFPVTFQQVRLSPPGSYKLMIPAPDLLNPLGALTQAGALPEARPNLYLLDPELATPYSHQYNLSWQTQLGASWNLQVGYVGSRSHKLLLMWYLNRARPVPGVPQTTATINQRRPDPRYAEIRWVLNGSRGYFDAGRVALVAPRWRGFSLEAAYWFSKALDLGSSYTNTAYDQDSRLSRCQSEFESHRDMKGPSSFDQRHAFLARAAWTAPGWRRLRGVLREWNLSGALLLKTGMPFTAVAGSDGPGYGNVDANGGDRPHLLDPSVLGRAISDPDTSRQRLPRAAFAYIQPTELRGNLGRNTFRKGGIRNLNAALAKTWTIRGEKRLTFRAESINLTNTPQFAEPGLELASANFGQITNTLNDGRTFRFLVRFGF